MDYQVCRIAPTKTEILVVAEFPHSHEAFNYIKEQESYYPLCTFFVNHKTEGVIK